MSAEKDIKFLSEAILHLDEEGLKKFNLSREDLYSKWTSNFVGAMRKSTKNMCSKDHALQMADAMINSMKKIVVDTRTADDESKVQVIINGLDFTKVFSDDIQLDVEPGATPKEIVGAITRFMVKRFEDIKLSKTAVFAVDCEYNEDAKFWMPKNMQAFLDSLTASALNIQ